MFISQVMSKNVVFSTPWDSARVAASLMKKYGVRAIPVVSEPSDPLLEGVVTDWDLCSRVIAEGKNPDAVKIGEVMTAIPVTSEPEETVEDCLERMEENQLSDIPVVDARGRCVGMISRSDVAPFASRAQLVTMLEDISPPAETWQETHFEKGYFYCGQLHEEDQILLLRRRREPLEKAEAVQ